MILLRSRGLAHLKIATEAPGSPRLLVEHMREDGRFTSLTLTGDLDPDWRSDGDGEHPIHLSYRYPLDHHAKVEVMNMTPKQAMELAEALIDAVVSWRQQEDINDGPE